MKIGITGHQDLIDDKTKKWLNEVLITEISNLSIDEAYSSLAAGADQLFAEIILSQEISLTVIIPSKKYEETFNKNSLEKYFKILKNTSSQILLDFDHPSETAFYEAGKFIVDNSDLLFAIWNNLPSKGFGGTADIVTYANNLNKKIIHLNPISKIKNFINYG